MYVQKIIRGIINLILIAMAALFSAGLLGSCSSYDVFTRLNTFRPSTYIRSATLTINGDTLEYHRIMRPQPLR